MTSVSRPRVAAFVLVREALLLLAFGAGVLWTGGFGDAADRLVGAGLVGLGALHAGAVLAAATTAMPVAVLAAARVGALVLAFALFGSHAVLLVATAVETAGVVDAWRIGMADDAWEEKAAGGEGEQTRDRDAALRERRGHMPAILILAMVSIIDAYIVYRAITWPALLAHLVPDVAINERVVLVLAPYIVAQVGSIVASASTLYIPLAASRVAAAAVLYLASGQVFTVAETYLVMPSVLLILRTMRRRPTRSAQL